MINPNRFTAKPTTAPAAPAVATPEAPLSPPPAALPETPAADTTSTPAHAGAFATPFERIMQRLGSQSVANKAAVEKARSAAIAKAKIDDDSDEDEGPGYPVLNAHPAAPTPGQIAPLHSHHAGHGHKHKCRLFEDLPTQVAAVRAAIAEFEKVQAELTERTYYGVKQAIERYEAQLSAAPRDKRQALEDKIVHLKCLPVASQEHAVHDISEAFAKIGPVLVEFTRAALAKIEVYAEEKKALHAQAFTELGVEPSHTPHSHGIAALKKSVESLPINHASICNNTMRFCTPSAGGLIAWFEDCCH